MIKRVRMFVSGVQESVLVDFVVKIKSKLSFLKISLQKRTNLLFFLYSF